MVNTSLVRMSDVMRHLGIPAGDMTYEAELQMMIDAVTPLVEYITGPINQISTTETYNVAHRSRVILNVVPVISITSCVEYIGKQAFTLTNQPLGSAVDNYGYSLDRPESGLLVRRGAFGVEVPFIGQEIAVTYLSGQAVVPPEVKLAVLEDLRALYQQTEQGGRPKFGGGTGDDDGWDVGPMHLFPRLAAILEGRARTQSIV